MDEDDEQRRGFRVTDRRRFADSGKTRDAAPPAHAILAQSEGATAPVTSESPLAGEPLVTFSTFVLGLSTQALLHLGEIPDPLSHQVQSDLEAAKQVIDVLGILADKTRNNLDAGEQALLESALYDLRMRYVELVGQESKERT